MRSFSMGGPDGPSPGEWELPRSDAAYVMAHIPHGVLYPRRVRSWQPWGNGSCDGLVTTRLNSLGARWEMGAYRLCLLSLQWRNSAPDWRWGLYNWLVQHGPQAEWTGCSLELSLYCRTVVPTKAAFPYADNPRNGEFADYHGQYSPWKPVPSWRRKKGK